MPKILTGPEHAQAALDHLAEAKALAAKADKATSREWKEAWSAQASACAQIAAAGLEAARLALEVTLAMPKVEIPTRDIKEWRDVTGVR